jgi:hypothetical protein
MNPNSYPFKIESNHLSFEFFSEGPNGRIKKVIQFIKLNEPNSKEDIYNLGFGDYNEAEGKIDDLAISDNKDTEKILVTIANAVTHFFDRYPHAKIFVKGSTPSRTRFYIINITKHLELVFHNFEVWGAISENQWEIFESDRPYQALLAKRK